MSGLSTTGSISFGLALVAGKNRVPRPATGNTAFVTFNMISDSIRSGLGPTIPMAGNAGMQSSFAGAMPLARMVARRPKIVWAFRFRMVTESRLNPTAMNREMRLPIYRVSDAI
ncbi:hypothetical protein [Burkholderia pyrrocinia]|uniref:hypothetical protein n=1 Tax=Burkholderia pyrrocinia TaxID=60550 RepID=UPI002AAFE997|nr:hypothetical protein [Burkholderia pyrrocinia]